MAHYIDAFVVPIRRDELETYQRVAGKVADIWREHGALDYFEYVGDGSQLDGTRTFPEAAKAQENEVVIFGWVSFESREARDLANKKVAHDPRMADLVTPITDSAKPIFAPQRMMYGGFRSLVP